MASVEHEPILGVWGRIEGQRDRGAEPLVSGVKPPGAESIFVFQKCKLGANLPIFVNIYTA